MADLPKRCPQCGERYPWYEAECPACHVALVEEAPDARPGLSIVTVFRTSDPAVLPLARLTLEREGIEYQILNEPWAGLRSVAGSRSPQEAALEIAVAADVAAKARDLLADLEESGTATGSPDVALRAAAEPLPSAPAGAPVVELEDLSTGTTVGMITEDQLQFLVNHLEAESSVDRDFYIDAATIDLLAEDHGDAELIQLLRKTLGPREGMDIRWAAMDELD